MFGYMTIKHLHVACVSLSILLFALRGFGVVTGIGAGLANHRFMQRLTMGIDTCMLVFGVWLLILLRLNPLAVHWLGLKLMLLVVYIVLGVFALKRAKTRQGKVWCWLAALGVVMFMYGMAKAHHPLGWLRWFGYA